MYGIKLPDRYNLELPRVERQDHVVNSGALDYMVGRGLPIND